LGNSRGWPPVILITNYWKIPIAKA